MRQGCFLFPESFREFFSASGGRDKNFPAKSGTESEAQAWKTDRENPGRRHRLAAVALNRYNLHRFA